MALVAYRVSGPAADQRAAERLIQFPLGITLRLTQWPAHSDTAGPHQRPLGHSDDCRASAAATPAASLKGSAGGSPASPQPQQQQRPQQQVSAGPQLSSLANVGLVVWQAGFLLADFLLREAPECMLRRRGGGWANGGGWRSLTAIDLGTGSGVVGIALALAGAKVYLTDLPHVVPLAAANVAANCDPRVHRAFVCPYRWGDDPAALDDGNAGVSGGGGGPAGVAAAAWAPASASASLMGVAPDIITAADVLYHADLLGPLMTALRRLSVAHTVSYVSYRVRQGNEVAAFLALAESAGFAAEEVPRAALHEEYRCHGRDRCISRGGSGLSVGLADGVGGADSEDGDDNDTGYGRLGLDVECGGASTKRWALGTYGILRLCRRDDTT
ncbi:hypothetical protein Vretimale_8325 [Volvox reticuliferus]|uniref:Uncharacterized protein n=1 Tax=Volvox reticuliferus TaxID=1737510 RepID=A0A8J4FMU3_9CHLO|nr:hypothetical protein Vretifemale_11701 [Volvox reticuliferus]GIM03593.1 hypothetical protein Vretimale_8325 [Volvox reticuliferus]